MTELVRTALKMIADPDLTHKDWEQVVKDQALDPDGVADGAEFCSVMYSNWVYAQMAGLILAGDESTLAKFIEQVDSRRLIRNQC